MLSNGILQTENYLAKTRKLLHLLNGVYRFVHLAASVSNSVKMPILIPAQITFLHIKFRGDFI
jgi:hypothetical protein